LLDSKLVCTGASEIRHLKEGQLVTVVTVVNPHEIEIMRFLSWHDFPDFPATMGSISVEPMVLEELRMLCRPLGFTLQEMEVTEILQEQGGSPDHGSHGKNCRIVEQLCNFMCKLYILIIIYSI